MEEGERKKIGEILESCTGCQECSSECQILRELDKLMLHDIAEQVQSGQADDDVRNFLLRCDLCGLCVQNCPDRLDIPGMVQIARKELLKKGVTDAETYRAMWVDHDWNTMTLYRDTYQIDYSDLIKSRCDTLFFPGCFLANEAPELVHSTVRWLTEQGNQEIGLTLMCCGSPLVQAGLGERAERYISSLRKTVSDTGARRIVTACPGCHCQLLSYESTQDLEIVSVFKLMAESGIRAPDIGIGRITVHDSCHDRKGETGGWVRQILSNYEIVEMAHHGANTLCCGSGGIVSMIDRELYHSRTQRRVGEFQDTGADVCVTYCMACCYTLLQATEPDRVRHVLELVFNQLIDHAQFAARLEAMWQSEWGDYNIYRLEHSHLMESIDNDIRK